MCSGSPSSVRPPNCRYLEMVQPSNPMAVRADISQAAFELTRERGFHNITDPVGALAISKLILETSALSGRQLEALLDEGFDAFSSMRSTSCPETVG